MPISLARLSPPLLLAALAIGMTPSVADAQGAAPAVRPQNADVFPVGKWPEGLVATESVVWVTQSGVRSVAQIDAKTGRLRKTVKIGRLPVRVGLASDGAPIVQVSTAQTISRVDPKTLKSKRLGRLSDYPQDMVVDGDHAYVLLWEAGSSTGSSVVRVHVKTGKKLRSTQTGASAFALTVGDGQIWVARGGQQLTVLDAQTLKVRSTIPVGIDARWMAHANGATFAAGGDAVVRVTNGAVSQRATLPARVTALAAWDDLVVAATEEGGVWLLNPKTLGVDAHLTPARPFRPGAISRHEKTLWLTHHGDGAKAGGLLVRIALP